MVKRIAILSAYSVVGFAAAHALSYVFGSFVASSFVIGLTLLFSGMLSMAEKE